MQDLYPLINQRTHEEVYLKTFYSNWYFYQNYKDKPHYKEPFKIVWK